MTAAGAFTQAGGAAALREIEQAEAQFGIVDRLHLEEERHDEHWRQLAEDHHQGCHEDEGGQLPRLGQCLEERVDHHDDSGAE